VAACGAASPPSGASAPASGTGSAAPTAAPQSAAPATPAAAPSPATPASPTAAAQPTTAPAATPAAQTAGNPTIAFWSSLMGSKEAARNQLVGDFQAANPGLKVQHEGFFDIMQNNEKLLAGNPPDVVSNHYYFVANYANANALESLDGYMATSKLASSLFIPSIYQLGLWQGKPYGLPIYADVEAYYYNTDLYKKAGLDPAKPPATWQDLIDVSSKLAVRQNGKLVQEGLTMPQDAAEDLSNMWYALLLQAGGRFLSPDGMKAAFNDDAGHQALQFMVDLIHKYKVTDVGFGQGADGAAVPFYAGKSAAEYADSTEFYYIRKYAPQLPYVVAPLPAGPKGQAVASQAFEMFIPRLSKNKDNAWTFVAFAMQPGAQIKFNKTSSHLPCETDALKGDPFFSSGKNMKPFYDSLVNFSKPFPIAPSYADILANLQQEFQSAVLGKEDVKTALDNAATYANQQLAKA
jgi:ABC-type glycerol-3-phosphate transport system substrate-binding protein